MTSTQTSAPSAGGSATLGIGSGGSPTLGSGATLGDVAMPPPRPPFPASLVLGALRTGVRVGGVLLPERTAALCHRLYFTPQRRPPSRDEQALAARARSFTVPFRSPEGAPFPIDGTLAAWSFGDDAKPAVVVAHGWEGRGLWLARAFVEPLLARGLRVVAFDMPGHGASPGKQSDVVSCAHALQTVAGVAARAGPVAAVLAHSLGGASTMIALSRGLAAPKVALLAPIVWMRPLPERFSTTLSIPPRAKERLYERLYRSFAADLWDSLAGAALAPSMAQPALVIQSSDDPETHPDGARTLVERWPGAKLVRVDGLGHYRLVSATAVVDEVVAFLAA